MPPRAPPFRLFTDGASRSNPGPAALGVALYSPTNTLHTTLSSRLSQPTTSNVAEYLACLRGLHIAHSLDIPSLKVFSDSELLVKQLTGLYSVRSAHLRPLHSAIQSAAKRFDFCEFHRIPRRENSVADKLANFALDTGCVDHLVHHVDKNLSLADARKSERGARGSDSGTPM